MSRFFKQEGDSDSDPEESEEGFCQVVMTRLPRPLLNLRLHQPGACLVSYKLLRWRAAQPQKKDRQSAKDKRLEEMEGTGKAIDNALKINHWVAISNEFDKLVRLAQRQTNVAERIPDFYIRTLSGLEDSLNTFNGTKQKVKNIDKEYEADIKHFQEDPEGFEREYAAAVTEPAVAQAEESCGKALGFTPDSVFKNLQTVQESCVQNNILERLLEVANTSYQRIRVLLALISSRFDYNSSVSTHMPISLWLASQREVDQLISIVMGDPSYSVQEITEDYDEFVERSPVDEKDGVVRIRGSIISFVDRLDDEFTKSLQNIDPHGTEYVDRLKDEKGLYESICQAQAFYETTNQLDPLARVIMRRLEHIYSKPDAVIQALEQTATQYKLVPSTTLATQGSSSSLIHSLSVSSYKSDNSFLRTRAMLCHIYHHALANEFYVARDMLLMSHLQESVHAADVATQILYNRTVVQLGLATRRDCISNWAVGAHGQTARTAPNKRREPATRLERGDGLGNDGVGQLQEEALEEVEVQYLLKG
ncbi:eukaryotic translation initiation factor 3 subunit 8 N-terminus-domain-containing protein [Gautieria morchelliformis]|nr:eukaryotic translation initiation factor 3 subunit 8 N-terminus-domain-containing protein [Gautieria morchelliformis]